MPGFAGFHITAMRERVGTISLSNCTRLPSSLPARSAEKREPLRINVGTGDKWLFMLLQIWNIRGLDSLRIENFDHFLVNAHQQMQARGGPGTVGYGR
jgi:hypothetical protein